MIEYDSNNDRLLFIDYETWGLGHYADIIMEIGWVITDWNLNVDDDSIKHYVISIPSSFAVDNEHELFAPHETNGLLQECLQSTITLDDVFPLLKQDIDEEIKNGHRLMLAGNSVAFDRDRTNNAAKAHGFEDMLKPLHYHLIDFSVLNEVFNAWNPNKYASLPQKITNHRAKNCLHDCINQTRFYKNAIFKIV